MSEAEVVKHQGFMHVALNQAGKVKLEELEHFFNKHLASIKSVCPPGRELSLVITKLEEACFFAKKAVCLAEDNQTGATITIALQDLCPRCNVSRSVGCLHYAPLENKHNILEEGYKKLVEQRDLDTESGKP